MAHPSIVQERHASSRPGSARLNVLIVDRHRLFAESVQWSLEAAGVVVADIVDPADGAVAAATRPEIDVVLLDVSSPGAGIAAGREILRHRPSAVIVGIGPGTDREEMSRAYRAGFYDYLPKNVSLKTLVARLESAAAGDPGAPRLVVRAEDASPERTHAGVVAKSLTNREKQILALMAEGASGPAIATRLGLSRNTVRTHAQNVLTKLQVGSRLEAVAFAVQHGIVSLPPDA